MGTVATIAGNCGAKSGDLYECSGLLTSERVFFHLLLPPGVRSCCRPFLHLGHFWSLLISALFRVQNHQMAQ